MHRHVTTIYGLQVLPGPVLLLATVLYNMLFVVTVSVAAMGP